MAKVLKSNWITQGKIVEQFESDLCNKCDAKFATVVNSATSALHIACSILGLTDNDYLWTTPNSFVASSNCGLYCGSKIDFVDIEKDTGLMCVFKLKEKLKQAEKTNKLPKVVIPVHIGGSSCNMEAINKLSKQFNFSVIEDASHAIGGKYRNQKIGSSKYCDMTIFSFHAVKIITTGEGGAVLTNSKEFKTRADRLRSHGITKNAYEFINEKKGDWTYEQQELGYNYRMTDFQAA